MTPEQKQLIETKKLAKAKRIKNIRYYSAILGASAAAFFSGMIIVKDIQPSVNQTESSFSAATSSLSSDNQQSYTPQPLVTSQS